MTDPSPGSSPVNKNTKLTKAWEPSRSVASWYLWRGLEPQYQDEE